MIRKQFSFLHPVSCPGGLRHFHCSYLSFCHLDASRVRWLFATLLSAVIRLFFIADRKKQMPSSPDGGRGLEPTAPGSTLGHKWANSPLKAFKSCSHDERPDCNVHLPRMHGWSSFSTSPSASSARSNLVQTKVTLNSTTSPGMRAMQYTGSKSIHNVLFRFSMLFACGIGSSLFFFSVSEPISHYTGWSLHHFCYKDSYSVSRS